MLQFGWSIVLASPLAVSGWVWINARLGSGATALTITLLTATVFWFIASWWIFMLATGLTALISRVVRLHVLGVVIVGVVGMLLGLFIAPLVPSVIMGTSVATSFAIAVSMASRQDRVGCKLWFAVATSVAFLAWFYLFGGWAVLAAMPW